MIAAGVAVLVALVALAGWWYGHRVPCVAQAVIVNLKSDPDTAFAGILADSFGRWLVLRKVTAIRADGKSTPMDGEQMIHRSNVAFIQVPGGRA